VARPGTFSPGQSGNPGGRPKATLNVQELARAHTEDAIQTLVEALKDPKLKVQAATALLDRGWGKPVQAIEASAQEDITVWHLIAATQFSERLASERSVIDGTATSDKPRFVVDWSKPALE
jgi:hypothetical protein